MILPFTLLALQNFVIKNDNLLPQKTIDKINEIGAELYGKTGIALYLVAVQKMPTEKIVDYEKELAQTLPPPFVLLTFALKDHKVDIYTSSPEVAQTFDKEQVLSPFPWKGTIIPLLESHSKNKKAAIEAALLNGYADIAEQIAASRSVELQSGIGSTNRTIYLALRILFYGILLLIFANFIYRRFIK
ncbi:MAG: hypothetical protein C6I05_00795 [Epsilonproteobacteria bacterium]|nr:hypothetical protein [Campylobacterota bacterium]